MSSVANETMRFSPKIQPDLSFPPKYPTNRDAVPCSRLRVAPDFGFPIHKLEPTREAVDPVVQSTPTSFTSLPPLLRLPFEIRLQIYADVLSSHSIFHAHLAPSPSSSSSTNPVIKEQYTPISQPLGNSLPTTSVVTDAQHKTIFRAYPLSTPSLVSSNPCRKSNHQQESIQGKIPTGLLASCKQIYAETHRLPWERNTFSFINWFWSGVYASRQFTKGLREWQCDSMRWVGVEVLTRDLLAHVEGKGKTDFVELCEMWKGVWGLKLGIKGSVRGKGSSALLSQGRVAEGLYARPGDLPQTAFEYEEERGILNVGNEWVREGLLALHSLRWMEIEIEDKDASREEKIEFCCELERALNEEVREEKGWDGQVKVVFVEKTRSGGDSNFMWFGGAPGDERED